MAESGIRDIFLAYPLVTESKIRRAMRLRGNTLTCSATSVRGEDAIPRSGGHHHGQRLGTRAGAGTPFCGGGSCRRRRGRGGGARGHRNQRDLRGGGASPYGKKFT